MMGRATAGRPHARTRSRWWLVLGAVLAAAALTSACSGELDDLLGMLDGEETPAEDQAATSEEGSPLGTGQGAADGGLECEREGYACTWDEVPAETITATAQLAEELDHLGDAGWDTEELAAHLDDHGEVVDAVVGTTSVRFRLEGSRPMWVLAEDSFEREGGAEAASSEPAPSLAATADASTQPTPTLASAASTPTGPAAHGAGGSVVPTTPAAVVGDDPASKSALVLSIHEHDGLDWGADEVAELLADTRGYEGGVEFLANTEPGEQVIGPEHFAGWDDYDVVFVATHGDQLCDEDGDCWTAMSLGAEILEVPADRHDEDVLQAYGYADTPGVALARSGNLVQPVMEGDWLAAQYHGQLDETLVYIQACSSARAGDLASGLAGDSSVFFGWSNTALAQYAGPTAVHLFTEMIERGVTTTTAFEEVRDDGMHLNQGTYDRAQRDLPPGTVTHRLVDGELQRVEHDEEVVVDAELLHHAPGTDLRVREVIELQDPEDGTRLTDGSMVPVSLSDGDGEAQELPVRLEIDGVLDGEADEFDVELVANGVGVAEWNLGGDGAAVDDEVWRIEDEVTLPPDLGADGELTLEAITQLPEGGTSHHLVDLAVPDLELHIDVQLETDIPTGFQEHARITGEVRLTAGGEDDTWSAQPDPSWSTYDHWFSVCPEASGILDTTVDLEVPRVSVDQEAGVGEVDLGLTEESGGPTITCAGNRVEVHLSGFEVLVTGMVVAEGGVPGPSYERLTQQTLDMVDRETIRVHLDAGEDPHTYVYEAADTASTSEWDMVGEVRITLAPRGTG